MPEILVVNGDSDGLKRIQALLERDTERKYVIHTSKSVAGAQVLHGAGIRFDAVIADNDPKGDGFELIVDLKEKYKRENSNLVAILTGESHPDQKESVRLSKLGCVFLNVNRFDRHLSSLVASQLDYMKNPEKGFGGR